MFFEKKGDSGKKICRTPVVREKYLLQPKVALQLVDCNREMW